MLGLGLSMIDTSTRLWHPTDVSSLEMWLIAREEYLTLDGTAIDAWVAKYGKAAAYNYTQTTGAQRPTWDAANQKVVTDGSNDNLTEGSNAITLDTSATGWTIAIVCTSSDWDSANQAFIGDKDGSNHFFRHDSSAQSLTIKNDGQLRDVVLDTPSALVNDQYYHIMATVQTNGDLVKDSNDVMGPSPKYSRRSLMTFFFLEIYVNAFKQINSVTFRVGHGNVEDSRILRNIVLTCPTSMIMEEQIDLRQASENTLEILKRNKFDPIIKENKNIPYLVDQHLLDKENA